jgi:fatty acid-binding protein DegV
MILFKEGEIFSGGMARGRQKSFEKALEQLMTYLDSNNANPDDYCVTVGYGYDEEEGKRLWMQTRAALLARYPGSACEVELLQIGCTIAVHTGPYALGMGVTVSNAIEHKTPETRPRLRGFCLIVVLQVAGG